MPLDQRTQLPDTPPRGVVVVVMVMRPLDPMIEISPYTDAASSRRAEGCGNLAGGRHVQTWLPSLWRVGIAAALSRMADATYSNLRYYYDLVALSAVSLGVDTERVQLAESNNGGHPDRCEFSN